MTCLTPPVTTSKVPRIGNHAKGIVRIAEKMDRTRVIAQELDCAVPDKAFGLLSSLAVVQDQLTVSFFQRSQTHQRPKS